MAYDQASRSLWLAEQLWPKLRDTFPEVRRIPQEVLITVGYPSSGARGRSEKIRPAEVNFQWQGNAHEKAFVSIHPIYFDSPRNAARALLFGAAKHLGPRWGPSRVGLEKEDDGTLTESPEAKARLDKVMDDVGEPPAGFGVAFPVRRVQRARLRKYVCSVDHCRNANGDDLGKHVPIRAASDTLLVNCGTCGNPYMKG